MTTERDNSFDQIAQDGRLVRTARMLDERKALSEGQRRDIVERFRKLLADTERHTQESVARELGISGSSFSGILLARQKGKAADHHLARLSNWLELEARREAILHGRDFVETAVARDILTVLGVVAETCQMGVVYGPARIGKSFTLESVEGDANFGSPVVIRTDESLISPFPLCREVCAKFEVAATGTFDAVFRRLVARLRGTRRTLIFDEVERVRYRTLEWIRDLHDKTGCPVLLCGKPEVYTRLGIREVGEFKTVTDQLAGRIVIRRDLTERTRGEHPEPLFTKADIRALATNAQLELRVDDAAIEWLQSRASALGTGGIGTALVCLYLAAKVADANGDAAITVDHLCAVDDLVMGHEDAARVTESVEQTPKIRRLA